MEDLDKLIVAKGFKKLPKLQWIAQSGRTGGNDYLKVITSLACQANCQIPPVDFKPSQDSGGEEKLQPKVCVKPF